MRSADQLTVLVTGATDGLGRQLARDLVVRGARVLVHGRDPGRIEATVRELRPAIKGATVDHYVADFASFEEVRRMAEQVTDRVERLDVLINNAGIGGGPKGNRRREVSFDGLELRFQVNYLAHFLLTAELLGLLRAGAPARVVNVASVGQEPLEFDDLQFERDFDGLRAYGRSKLAMIMWTFSLAERLADTGVTVNALHPASLMDTKMALETFGHNMTRVEDGARATLRLVLDEELDGVTGHYFNGDREARANPQAYDLEARKRLWSASEQLVGSRASVGS